MHSRESFFKSVLIQKASLRFWPAWALHLIILLFAVVIPVYRAGIMEMPLSILTSLGIGYHSVLIFCLSLLFALLLFSWLYSARSANMMHAFPVKRSQLFASHYITGLGFLIVPQIIIFLVIIPGCLGYGVSPGVIGLYLLHALACDFIFYTIAVLCCMMAGHLLSALVYCLIFNSVFVIARTVFTGIQESYGYGLFGSVSFSGGKGTFLSPVVFIASRCGVKYDLSAKTVAAAAKTVHIEGGIPLLGFCLATIGILIFAMYLYRLRHIECAGEMSAFRALNPTIRWIVAICCGTASGFAMTAILFEPGYMPASFKLLIVLVIVFSLIWYLVTEMVLKKSFRIFRPKLWAEWGVMCAVILCLLGAVKGDAFHIVYNVPEAKDVSAVMVQGNYMVVATEPEEIERARTLHQTFLDKKKYYEKAQTDWYRESSEQTDSSLMQDVSITYFLKSGKQLERTYMTPVTKEEVRDDTSALAVLTEMETPESAMKIMLGKDYSAIRFTDVLFDGETAEGVDAQKLFEAIKKDVEAGSVHYRTKDRLKKTYLGDMALWEDDSIPVSLTGTADGNYKSSLAGLLQDAVGGGREEFDDSYYYNGSYYYLIDGSNISHAETRYDSARGKTEVNIDFWINSDCENTCAILKEYGVIEEPSDLDQILIEQLHNMYPELQES